MKRGLKGRLRGASRRKLTGCTNYPDEKGTESYKRRRFRAYPISCTNYPDEKGTERAFFGLFAAEGKTGCTNYPDEKGTESESVELDEDGNVKVALITPMKRGLKDL